MKKGIIFICCLFTVIQLSSTKRHRIQAQEQAKTTQEQVQSKQSIQSRAGRTGDFMINPPTSSFKADDFHIVSGTNAYLDANRSNVVVITDNENDQKGAIWSNGMIDLTRSFDYTSYVYYGRSNAKEMGLSGGWSGDGMTITLHNDPRGVDTIADPGGGLGVYSSSGAEVKNALSFEIDPYPNMEVDGYDFGLPMSWSTEIMKHVAFLYPNDASGYPKHREATNFLTIGYKESEWMELNFNWSPQSDGSAIIAVKINGYNITHKIDDYEKVFDGSLAHLGFTGSTGGATALQAVAMTQLPEFRYVVEFDLNGGQGTVPEDQSLLYDDLLTPVPDPIHASPTDHVFMGWNTAADGSGTMWDFNTMKMPRKRVTLYAQWMKKTPAAPVTVKYIDENNKELVPDEILNGFVGDPYQTTAKDIPNYALKTTPANATGVFESTTQTVTYVYERIAAKLTVEFVNENSQVLPGYTVVIDTFMGETIDLTKEQTVVDQLDNLIKAGYTIAKKPTDETAVKVDQTAISVQYIVQGVLSLSSGPKALNFGKIVYEAKAKRVENPQFNEELVVTDTRADASDGFTVTATLSTPMKNKSGQELVDALRYVYNGTELVLNKNSQVVYQNTKGTAGSYAITDSWGTTKGTDGLKLQINSSDIVFSGNYEGVITWKVMAGQP